MADSDPWYESRAIGPVNRAYMRFLDGIDRLITGSVVKDEAPGGSARDDGWYVIGPDLARRPHREEAIEAAVKAAGKNLGSIGPADPMRRVDPAVLAKIAEMMRK